jgi:hydantoinase/carbamoylase family amidase
MYERLTILVLSTGRSQYTDPVYQREVLTIDSEEGARFPKSMCSSGVWAGLTPIGEAWNLRDVSNPSTTLLSELKRIGFHGDIPCSSTDGVPLGAHFELHIEQGPILEAQQRKIGVVLGAQAYRWLSIKLVGRDAHTGTTPWSARKDPVLAGARMIASAASIAQKSGALAATGIFNHAVPGSVNTIAGSAKFTLDIRHSATQVVADVQQRCIDKFKEIAQTEGSEVDFSYTIDTQSDAVIFDTQCVKAIRKSAIAEVGEAAVMDMTSGAGHDSVNTSAVCPSAMIFVPCRDGVSHHPTEYSTMAAW